MMRLLRKRISHCVIWSMFLLFFHVSTYIFFAFYVLHYLSLIESSILDIEDELESEMYAKHTRRHTDSMAHRKQNLIVPISLSLSLFLSISSLSLSLSVFLAVPFVEGWRYGKD